MNMRILKHTNDDLNSRIKNNAVDLFNRYGIKSVSIEDITNTLHISKKTFYNSFLNKEELVMVLANDTIRELKSRIVKVKHQHQGLEEFLWIQYELFTWLSKLTGSMVHDLKKYYPNVSNQYMKLRTETLLTLTGLLKNAKLENFVLKSVDVRLFCEVQMDNMEDFFRGRWASVEKAQASDLFEQLIVNSLRGILTNSYGALFSLESFWADLDAVA